MEYGLALIKLTIHQGMKTFASHLPFLIWLVSRAINIFNSWIAVTLDIPSASQITNWELYVVKDWYSIPSIHLAKEAAEMHIYACAFKIKYTILQYTSIHIDVHCALTCRMQMLEYLIYMYAHMHNVNFIHTFRCWLLYKYMRVLIPEVLILYSSAVSSICM